jgi:hypothetical protein
MPMANTRTAVTLADHTDDQLTRLSRLVRVDYAEMPGLSLTLEQAMRLWNLDQARCRRVLEQLVRTGFLIETRQGLFRRSEGSS